MRILIDECVDPRVKPLFASRHSAGLEAITVHEQGWDSIKDGPLLQLAQSAFDVFLTIDRKLEYQQNLHALAIGVVVVTVPKNQMKYYRDLQEAIVQAVLSVHMGEVLHVGSKET